MYRYVTRVQELINEVFDKEAAPIAAAIELLTETILSGQSIFIFGASHAGILAQELYYRAGGLMAINPIFGRELMLDRSPISFTSKMERLEGYGTELAETVPFRAGDVIILHSVSGRNSVVIDMAIAAIAKGVKIIALTNVEYSQATASRHSSGKRLFELADIVIDNHGDIGDAAVKIDGIDQSVGATSTVIGVTVLNAIIVEVVQRLVDAGVKNPPIYYSSNLDGGDELNGKLFAEHAGSIHYQL